MGSLEALVWAGPPAFPRTRHFSMALIVVVPSYVSHRRPKFGKLNLFIFLLVLFLKDMGQVIFALLVTDPEEVREIPLQHRQQARLVDRVTGCDVFVGPVGRAHHGLLSLSVAPLGFQRSRDEEVSRRGRTSVLPSLSPIPVFDTVAKMMPLCILLFSLSTSSSICTTFTRIHKYYSAHYYKITIHLHNIPSKHLKNLLIFQFLMC